MKGLEMGEDSSSPAVLLNRSVPVDTVQVRKSTTGKRWGLGTVLSRVLGGVLAIAGEVPMMQSPGFIQVAGPFPDASPCPPTIGIRVEPSS